MAKNKSLLNKYTAFEHKFHFDMKKWQKRQNDGQFTILLLKKLALFGQKQLDLNENIEETA
jgi:coproporphyrinogen III oxidase